MTRNDTRIIHTDGLDEGIRCAMCTNPMANDRGCDGGCTVNESMYKRVLDVIDKKILEQEPCDDAISRKMVKEQMIKYGFHAPDMTVTEFVEDILSAKPQEPEKRTEERTKTHSCDCISRQAVIEQINCWIGSGEYRYTNATYYLTKRMQDIPPVTPQPKIGHWITENMFDGDVAYRCSECNELFWIECGTPKDNEYNFCPNCGAKMEEGE